jgi:hypothetical protein
MKPLGCSLAFRQIFVFASFDTQPINPLYIYLKILNKTALPADPDTYGGCLGAKFVLDRFIIDIFGWASMKRC